VVDDQRQSWRRIPVVIGRLVSAAILLALATAVVGLTGGLRELIGDETLGHRIARHVVTDALAAFVLFLVLLAVWVVTRARFLVRPIRFAQRHAGKVLMAIGAVMTLAMITIMVLALWPR
jgi:hypothetical protein